MCCDLHDGLVHAPVRGSAGRERRSVASGLRCALRGIRCAHFPSHMLSRAYMSVKELKETLQLNGTHFLNVYFASSVREDLAGAATWPWDKEAVSHLGK